MPKIYLDTVRINANAFDLIQTKEIGFERTERKFNYETSDIIRAWFVNIGYACQYFQNKNCKDGIIVLDGNTEIEIDIYKVLQGRNFSYGRFTANYGTSHYHWFKRIFELINTWEITVELNSDKVIVKDKPETNRKQQGFINRMVKARKNCNE